MKDNFEKVQLSVLTTDNEKKYKQFFDKNKIKDLIKDDIFIIRNNVDETIFQRHKFFSRSEKLLSFDRYLTKGNYKEEP